MRYWWMVMHKRSRDQAEWLVEVVTMNEHPFAVVREENTTQGTVTTLLNWREITREEYKMHPEGA